MKLLQLADGIDVAYLGPPKEAGPLPAVFYFALSFEETLNLDPYNQPALYLSQFPLRVFSFDLPAHGPNLNAIDAIKVWAEQFEKGEDPLAPFLEKVGATLQSLIDRRWVLKEKIGLMGLSRGGLIASLVGASFPDIKAISAFAPMTSLYGAKEFANIEEDLWRDQYDLSNHVDALCDKHFRFYIGNRDVRVSTERCMHLVSSLANKGFEKGLRSPPVEMIITPSIGHMGHGTSKETFEHGAHFLGKKLGVIR